MKAELFCTTWHGGRWHAGGCIFQQYVPGTTAVRSTEVYRCSITPRYTTFCCGRPCLNMCRIIYWYAGSACRLSRRCLLIVLRRALPDSAAALVCCLLSMREHHVSSIKCNPKALYSVLCTLYPVHFLTILKSSHFSSRAIVTSGFS